MNVTIRKASEGDVSAIEGIVYEAYKHYIPRIGKQPSPMTDDYHRQVASGNIWVLLLDSELVGVVVLIHEGESMLLDNVAVRPTKQHLGLGRRLIAFAEARARESGCREVRLYTNEVMYENLVLYRKLGYQEISRRHESGFNRVFMRKAL